MFFLKPEFTIERVSEETFAEFLYLLDCQAAYERLDPPCEEAWLRLKVDLMQTPPKIEGYIGRIRDKSIGYVTFSFTYSPFLARPILFLEDIFVLEEYQGECFGKRLFDFCRNEARIRGCGRMDWMVLTWNKPSLQFYEQNGANRLGWYSYRLEQAQV